MRGIIRLSVIWLTVLTFVLLAAVGASAASGTLGSAKALKPVVTLLAPENNGNHTGQCHSPKRHHKHGTPGHKKHPCGEDGDDSD
jgi:hypothetical protein